jgi:hypothetical protein
MRGLKNFEINIVGGGTCTSTSTTSWTMCVATAGAHSGDCTGGVTGKMVNGGTTVFYYCAQEVTSMSPYNQANLITFLITTAATGYCQSGDTLYGFSSNAGTASTGFAGYNPNGGGGQDYAVTNTGCA